MKRKILQNIGTPGRILRLSLGIALLLYAYWGKSWVALIFALFTLFEAWQSWCVVYQILGKSSCPIKRKK